MVGKISFAFLAVFAIAADAKDFTAVENGVARAQICVESPELEAAKHAASELQKYVKAMTGAESSSLRKSDLQM